MTRWKAHTENAKYKRLKRLILMIVASLDGIGVRANWNIRNFFIILCLMLMLFYLPERSAKEVLSCNNHLTEYYAFGGHFTDPLKKQIVHGGFGSLYCVDALTGESIWQLEYSGSGERVLSSWIPYRYWYPIKISASSMLDLLIWQRTDAGDLEWQIINASTKQKLTKVPIPPGIKFDYAEALDLDNDNVAEVVFRGWHIDYEAVYHLRENKTILIDDNFLTELIREVYPSFEVNLGISSSFYDFDHDDCYEMIVQARNESGDVVAAVYDWMSNWSLVNSILLPNAWESDYLIWGNFTGNEVLDAAIVQGWWDEPIGLRVYDGLSGELVMNRTIYANATLIHPARIFYDLTGDGVLEWLFPWQNDSNAVDYDQKYSLTMIDLVGNESWQINYVIPPFYLHAHGIYPPGYFDDCFGDFTGDGTHDIALPSSTGISIIDGSSGEVLRSYKCYPTPYLQVFNSDEDNVPDIVFCKYIEQASKQPYQFAVIDGNTMDFRWGAIIEKTEEKNTTALIGFSPLSVIAISILLTNLILHFKAKKNLKIQLK